MPDGIPLLVYKDVVPVPCSNGQNPLLIIGRPGWLYGWSMQEFSGATAEIDLFDGTSINGVPIANVNLLPNQSTRDIVGWPGIWCGNGLCVNAASGSANCVMYWMDQ